MGGTMVFDAIRGYLQLASGLTELSRAKAVEAANAVLNLPTSMASGPMAAQVSVLADELLAAATTNRASLLALVRAEVEKAVGHAALVPAADLDRARASLLRLSADLEELREQMLGSPAMRSMTESGVAAIAAMTGHRGGDGSHDPGPDGLGTAGTDSTSAALGSSLLSGDEELARTTRAAARARLAAKKASPVKRASSVGTRASAAKKAPPVKRASSAGTRASAAKKASPVKRASSAGTRASAAKKASPVKRASSAGTRASAAKKASPAKKASAAQRTAAAKNAPAAPKASAAQHTAGQG